MLFRTLILRASSWGFVRNMVRNSRLFKPVVSRFIAGDTTEQAMAVAEDLASQGFNVSLDLLGENVATLAEAERARDAYVDIVQRIAKSANKDKINISIKLTALGLDQGDDVCEANYRQLLQEALPHNIFIRADMEASEYTERTIAMVERVFPDFPNTGTVLQSYLYRTEDDVERLIRLGCRVRMVKGAYLEPDSVAYQDKAVVDAKYIEYAKKLMLRSDYPAIASHDEAIIRQLQVFAESEKIHSSRFEWQMLYGIRRDLQKELLDKGDNVRVYVPYGDSWYPYFTRRLAERPANLFFIIRAMLRR